MDSKSNTLRYLFVRVLFIFSLLSSMVESSEGGTKPEDVTYWDDECRKILYSSSPKSSFLNEFKKNTCSSFKESRILVEWGLTLPEEAVGKNCDEGDKCLDFGVAKLVVNYEENCERIHWTTNQLSELKDCLNLFGHWYGGGEQFREPWPVEKVPWTEVPFLVSDKLNGSHDVFGSVTESYWVSSYGIAARVDATIPLFLSLPDTDDDGSADKMCFSSKYQKPFVADTSDGSLNLTYYLCYADNVREVYETSFPKFFSYPGDIPDERMVTHPIWSTWAQYGRDVNVSRVMDVAKTVKAKGFNNSQLELDDHWETCYGDAIFDPAKFPDPKGMVKDLHSMGYRVTIWSHPFINNDCESFTLASQKGYLVKGLDGKTKLTKWWNSANDSAGIIDFTNIEAVKWWKLRLEKLKVETGLDGFKFDAGEAFWLPVDYTLNLEKKHWPNGYTTAYVDSVASFGSMIEVRVGFGSQKNPIFVRMMDKLSVWDDEDGLRTLVPSLLHSGLLGYPFVLPDMIGGNAYDGIPSPELFVRWAQANTFMPGIQFSLLPWNFDHKHINVTQITQDVSKLHEKFSPLIMELARNATLGMGPIARPTWWLCPTNEYCLVADQQFLLGDDVLVTPVVHEGVKSIDVVFPPGLWEQSDSGDIYEGISKQTISGITIDSNIYFERV